MKLVKWRGIVARAKKRGRFTQRERERAADWPKCAMGERYHFRRGGYTWLSNVEQVLSFDFMHAVERNLFPEAMRLIRQIEALPKP